MSTTLSITERQELIRMIDEANSRMWQIRGSTGISPEAMLKELFMHLEKIDYPFGKAQTLLNAAMGSFIFLNDEALTFSYLNQAMEIFRSLDNKKWIANTHSIFGIFNNTIGNRESALYHALRVLDHYENHPEETLDSTMAYYVIGTVYRDLKKYEEAEKYYLRGTIGIDIGANTWGGRIYAGLASVHTDLKNYDTALKYSFIALEKLSAENNYIGISRAYTDIGIIYKKQGAYKEALKYLQEGMKLRQERNLKKFEITSRMEIATLYRELEQHSEALAHLEEAEKIAADVNQLNKLARIYHELSSVHRTLSDYPKALLYSDKLLELNEQLYKKESEERIKRLQDTLMKEKKEEIERLRNVELKNAYDIISEKNKEIVDSIHYAKRIQTSLLTTEKYIEKNLSRLNRERN